MQEIAGWTHVVISETELSGIAVVVVDDHLDTLEAIKALLEAHGARTAVAASAQEGLVLVQAFDPDVVLSDLSMPDEDGYAFIRKLHGLFRRTGSPIPVIAVSAHVGVDERERARTAGFQAFLAKPLNTRALVTCIRWVQRLGRNDRRKGERRKNDASRLAAGFQRREGERRQPVNCASLPG